MNHEQELDCQSVWRDISIQHPEFTRQYDPTNNWHAVRELILGGSLAWAGFHKRFQPAVGTKVMDLGANVGIYSAYCDIHGADVTAYEPDPDTFRILESLNLNATLINLAVGKHQRARFRGIASTDGGRLQRNGAILTAKDRQYDDEYFVDSVSFDAAIGHDTWDCIKMDIEGSEFDIFLNAAPETLCRIKFMFVELHPWVDQDLYDVAISRIQNFFDLDGGRADTGRWEYLYLRMK